MTQVLDVKEAVEALEFMKRAGEAGSGKKKAQTQGSNDGQSP